MASQDFIDLQGYVEMYFAQQRLKEVYADLLRLSPEHPLEVYFMAEHILREVVREECARQRKERGNEFSTG